MKKEFEEEFKNLSPEDIANFVNNWTEKKYGKPFLAENDYQIQLVENKKELDYLRYWRIELSPKRAIVILNPFQAFGTDLNTKQLTVAWKKYLNKSCPHYLEAYLDNAHKKAKEVIHQAQLEIDEFIR
jgi:hypothetical protein